MSRGWNSGARVGRLPKLDLLFSAIAPSVKFTSHLLALMFAVTASPSGIAQDRNARALEHFESHVRPLLLDQCFDCHGGGRKDRGDLAMRTRAELLQGGSRGPAIVPGDPEASLLIQVLRLTHVEVEMPPSGKLAPEEIEALAAWIRAGAVWPSGSALDATDKTVLDPNEKADTATLALDGRGAGPEWAFQACSSPTVPAVVDADWPRNDIDRFVLARMEAQGLKPAPDADRRTWLRRVSFDLIGLPPTPEELAAFLADDSSRAFENVVERLLSSPHYGERWGRHWLDLARYADTAGDSSDYPIQDAWRYRNYVIQSFNEDLPYDEFLKEQIAGDILAARDPTQRFEARTVSTGFLALSRRFGVGKDASRELILEDTIDTLGRSVMGMTLRCARCHDHKYDPISQQDYYALYGIFDSTIYPFPGSENERKPDRLVPLLPPVERDKALAAWKRIDEQFVAERSKLEASQAELKHRIDALAAFLDLEEAEFFTSFLTPELQLNAADYDRAKLTTKGEFGTQSGVGWVEYDFEAPFAYAIDIELDTSLSTGPPLGLTLNGEVLPTHAPSASNWEAFFPRELRWEAVAAQSGPNVLRIERFANGPTVFEVRVGAHRIEPSADSNSGLETQAEWLARNDVAGQRTALEARRDGLQMRIEALDKQRKANETKKPRLDSAYAVIEGKAHDARIHKGGNRNKKGARVARGFPSAITVADPPPIGSGSGRLELAEWLTRPDHPLTARVFVNRLWQQYFGHGLVRTSSNFGLRGERPTHPALLDWLATGFIERGWSIKALHRNLVLSRTYRQSSLASEASGKLDPENRLLSYFSRRRLDAEALRDSLLAVSGGLDRSEGQAHPFPALSKWNWTQHRPFQAVYPSDKRSVYLMTQRIRQHPYLSLFDGPDTNASTALRTSTTVPTQALFLLNSEFVHRQAEAFARRILESSRASRKEQVDMAFEWALGRPAHTREQEFAASWLDRFPTKPDNGNTASSEHELPAWTSFARSLFASNEFVYLD